MDGLGLLRFLVESTGLPPESLEKELNQLLKDNNLNAETLTLDQVRDVLALYLQDVLIEAKESTG